MANELNFTIPVNELAAAIAERLAPLFLGLQPQAPPPAEKYLTRKQTAEQLNVSLPTLNVYTKKNLIVGYRFGVRVMYKTTDIEASLKNMSYGRGAGHV
ncbi:MAG: helix-turn-helix domain-containing protein [Ferruginibacter sp.]